MELLHGEASMQGLKSSLACEALEVLWGAVLSMDGISRIDELGCAIDALLEAASDHRGLGPIQE